jgi:chemotaxis protein MotB
LKSIPVWLPLSLLLGACAPMDQHHALQRENDAQKQAALQNQNSVRDIAASSQRNVDLALQNHRLKIEREDLLRAAREKRAFYDSVTRDLRREIAAGRMRVGEYGGVIIVEVSDELLFDSARAQIKPQGGAVLLKLAKLVAKVDRTIRVVGHTDDQPMAEGAVFASNWELSTARATAVVRYLQEKGGLDPGRLLAGGRGQWKPVASNATEAGRQANRRITLSLVEPGYFDGSEPIPQAVTRTAVPIID